MRLTQPQTLLSALDPAVCPHLFTIPLRTAAAVHLMLARKRFVPKIPRCVRNYGEPLGAFSDADGVVASAPASTSRGNHSLLRAWACVARAPTFQLAQKREHASSPTIFMHLSFELCGAAKPQHRVRSSRCTARRSTILQEFSKRVPTVAHASCVCTDTPYQPIASRSHLQQPTRLTAQDACTRVAVGNCCVPTASRSYAVAQWRGLNYTKLSTPEATLASSILLLLVLMSPRRVGRVVCT